MMSSVDSHIGKVRFFYRKKRYGFIEGDGGVEIFFPSSTAGTCPNTARAFLSALTSSVVTVDPRPPMLLFSIPLRFGVPHLRCNGPYCGTRECQWILFGTPSPLEPVPVAVLQSPLVRLAPHPVLTHVGPGHPPALPFPPPVFPPASPVSLPSVTWPSPALYSLTLVGRVRQHSRAEGYGLIGTPNGTEYPFHDSSLVGLPSVLDNTDVAFEAAPMSGGGAFAVNVRPFVGSTLSTTAPRPSSEPLDRPTTPSNAPFDRLPDKRPQHCPPLGHRQAGIRAFLL
eukprot:TRINITY_DN4159_c0_g1_i1.p1 TRINITY_DN4159_c0_g1~~TRINITY_DN4159_c0_g1_i1.p1  ORF type:complete len:290 (-),score=6.72 TRINITY_DN4159_c0_g1_i1:444-1292(-)